MSLFADARLRLFCGAVLISFSPIFVALVSVSPTVSAFYRVSIGGAALGLIWLFGTRDGLPARQALVPLGGAAIFFALDLWFWHRSIGFIGAGRSTLLANLQVFFMIAAGALLLAERPTVRQIVSAGVAVVGLAIMLGPAWVSPTAHFRLGVALGILTAASYAGYLLCLRLARQRSHARLPTREVAVISLAAALVLAVSAYVEGHSLAVPSLGNLGWLAGYGLMSHAGGVMLIASSLTRVPPAQAGIALLLQPALSYVWELLLFDRAVVSTELAGASLTLIAIYFGTVRARASGRATAT